MRRALLLVSCVLIVACGSDTSTEIDPINFASRLNTLEQRLEQVRAALAQAESAQTIAQGALTAANAENAALSDELARTKAILENLPAVGGRQSFGRSARFADGSGSSRGVGGGRGHSDQY